MAFRDLNQGHKYHREDRNYDSAYFYYRRAAAQYQRANQQEQYAYCLLRSAFSAHRGQKYSLAQTHYQQSLDVYESLYPEDNLKLANPSMGLGSLYAVTGNYYQALIYTTRSLNLKREFLGEDHIDTGVNYYNAGTAYMNYGEYESAMDAYQKALKVYLNHYQEDNQRVSSLYVNMGILYDKRGEPEKALEYYQRSTSIDQRLYGDDFYLLAYNYYNMAISYFNIDSTELAEQHYHKAIALSKLNNLQELHANGLYGLGNIAAGNGQSDQAMQFYQQAIELFMESFGEDFPGINHTYRAVAELYTDRGAYQRAHEYLQITLDLLVRNFDQKHPFLAATHKQISLVYTAQGRYNEALQAIERGYQTLSKNGTNELEISTDNYLDHNILLDLVRQHGAVLEEKYSQSHDLSDLELALSTLERATEFIDQIRRGFMLDQSKLLIQQQAMITYEQAINIAFELYQLTADNRYLDKVFSFMEKSKATLLSESLQGNSLKHIQGIPDSLLTREQDLKKMISFTEGLTFNNEYDKDSLDNQLFMLRRSYDALSELIADKYPKYYNLKYQVRVRELNEVQDNLDPTEAILSYFIGSNTWFVLGITNKQAVIHKIDSTAIQELDIIAFRSMVSNPAGSWDNQVSFRLYGELVAGTLARLEPSIKKLIVVPVGALSHIPFGAMTTATRMRKDGKLPFLIHDYSITYTPSITLMSLTSGDSFPGPRYRGFAPVDYQGELTSLVGSYNEVVRANELFGGETFLHQEATENNFKKSGSARILHLAMHAQIDDREPMRSKLIFSNELDSIEDGNLYASEIYNLNLYSNLTVLSSCNTGYGKLIKGEGVMNLSRAFQYAGSPAIVMSLWQATDASTSAIMHKFFKNLKSGISKDESLRLAKIDYLSNADPLKSHPAHWAAFVLLGDSRPLPLNGFSWKWLIAGGVLLMVVIIRFVYKSSH